MAKHNQIQKAIHEIEVVERKLKRIQDKKQRLATELQRLNRETESLSERLNYMKQNPLLHEVKIWDNGEDEDVSDE